MKIISKYKIELICALLGAGAGYAYWYYVGCASGQCAITARWYTSALYGVVLGFLVGQMITERKRKNNKKTEE